MKHLLRVGLALVSLSAHALDTAGWKPILATKKDIKNYPPEQAKLDDGLLFLRASTGIMVPEPTPDGAIRARVHFHDGTTWPQLRIRHSEATDPKVSECYVFIFDIKPGQTSVTEGWLNCKTKGKTKSLGKVPLPAPFAVGDHIDVELSAVGEHLQVRLNEKIAFEIDDNSLATGSRWGVAAGSAWFSNISVRSLKPGPKPGVAPGITPAQSNDLRLVQLEEAYAAAIEREIPLPAHLEAIKSLDTKYAAALDRALEAATKAGNLDAALALQNEKKRLQDETPLPEEDRDAPEVLKPLRSTYRSALSQLNAQREQRLQPLREKFLQALDAYQAELTRAKNLDGALEVRKRREQEAASAKAP